MGLVNWTKSWPNKSWKARGKRLDHLKKAYEKKAKGIIAAQIKKLKENKKKGIGSARSQFDITSFKYELTPVTGQEGEFFSVTTIDPPATDTPVIGGGGGSLVSPTPPPHP